MSIGVVRFWGRFGAVLETYRRVPFFFYILHFYVIQLAAAPLGFLQQPGDWFLHGRFFLNYDPDGQPRGHGLRYVGRRDSAALLALCLVCTRQEETSRLAIAVPLVKQVFVGVNAFETTGFNWE
jgi:hypothetical protein